MRLKMTRNEYDYLHSKVLHFAEHLLALIDNDYLSGKASIITVTKIADRLEQELTEYDDIPVLGHVEP